MRNDLNARIPHSTEYACVQAVLYIRSNLIKHAIALIRGGLFETKCGGHANMRAGESCSVGLKHFSFSSIRAALLKLTVSLFTTA